MNLRFSEKEEAFRKEVDQFLEEVVTPELVEECRLRFVYQNTPVCGPGPHSREFSHKLGEKGLLGMTWPKEYGGYERSLTEEFIAMEEMGRYRVTLPSIEAPLMIGPAILHYGSEEQKKNYLPRIARGEIHFALGYTEPEAGSDLASLDIRAVEDGDDYVVQWHK